MSSSSRNMSGSSLALLPGMKVDLVVNDYFARTDTYDVYNNTTGETETKNLVNGFYVEDETAGTIIAIAGKAGVTYQHIKARENNIWFIALTEVDGEPEKGLFSVIYVPIHDHSSIVVGGPAYATYQSEGNREVEEEGS